MSENMYKISSKIVKANDFLGKTIEMLNTDLIHSINALNPENMYTVGIKNSSDISKKIIKDLCKTNDFFWLTIDKMSDGGRAIDINLLNPITTKTMTGSSSATAINVLYGINDLGIGTDGGGSVLDPAISLNLYSVMLKGMGLKGNKTKYSTDGIPFNTGIGFISHSYKIILKAISKVLDIEYSKIDSKKYKVGILESKDRNMKDVLEILKDNNYLNYYFYKSPNFINREKSIKEVKKIFEEVDVLLSFEGPVDYYGIGDTVFGSMGNVSFNSQLKSGKGITRIANMINATCITIPVNEIASSVVVTTKEGIINGVNALEFAKQFQKKQKNLYYKYFKDSIYRKKDNIIFSLKEV